MEHKIVLVDMSIAYLWTRFKYEGRLAVKDEWLSQDRRKKVGNLYIIIGKDFERFLSNLNNIRDAEKLYTESVRGLETFRDNLDMAWYYAYSGNLKEIILLSRMVNYIN